MQSRSEAAGAKRGSAKAVLEPQEVVAFVARFGERMVPEL